MSRTARPAIIGVARLATIGLALSTLAAACGPGPAASTSPSVTTTSSASGNQSLTATFRSPMMGYSVKYPIGWRVTPATAVWKRGTIDYWDYPELDKLDGKTAGFHGTSQALAPGQSASAWIDEYVNSSMTCGTKEQVPVGNQIGTIDLNGCVSDAGHGGYAGLIYDIAVVAGGRGYNFAMEGQVDRAFFLAILATVTLTPQTATDATTPSTS